MSHSTIVYSPAGTPLADRTVGELVAERPSQSRVFQAFGIDFCCQGGRTLREACERKEISLDTVIEQLEAAASDRSAPEWNPAELEPEALAAYIVEKHHKYVRTELPRLHAMAARVAHVHGGHTPSLVEVFGVFQGLSDELSEHLIKEESVLFPAITALSHGEPAPVTLNGPISCMLHEHDDAGQAMAKIRELTNGFQPPAEACNTYRALFAGLQEFEEDLHTHIHLENSVLFPSARALEAAQA